MHTVTMLIFSVLILVSILAMKLNTIKAMKVSKIETNITIKH